MTHLARSLALAKVLLPVAFTSAANVALWMDWTFKKSNRLYMLDRAMLRLPTMGLRELRKSWLSASTARNSGDL